MRDLRGRSFVWCDLASLSKSPMKREMDGSSFRLASVCPARAMFIARRANRSKRISAHVILSLERELRRNEGNEGGINVRLVK